MSADGSTVVGIAWGVQGAFRWTLDGGFERLPSLGGPELGYSREASAVSADGSVVVGGEYCALCLHGEKFGTAFRWTAQSGTQSLGRLAGGSYSRAYGVSGDGAVVVGDATSGSDTFRGQAFRWTAESGMVGLGFLAGRDMSVAFAISGDGSTIVGDSSLFTSDPRGATTRSQEAFRWTQQGGMVGMGWLTDTDFQSSATGVSANGAVVVGYSGRRAFRWTIGSGMVALDQGAFAASRALGVSGDGAVIVGDGFLPGADTTQAFRWTEATAMQSVAEWLAGAGVALPEGLVLTTASGTNADGSVVVGTSSARRAWLARVGGSGNGFMGDIDAFTATLGASGDRALRSGLALSGLALDSRASSHALVGAAGNDYCAWASIARGRARARAVIRKDPPMQSRSRSGLVPASAPPHCSWV